MDYHCKASFLSDLMVGVTSTSAFGCPLVGTVVDELTIKVILPEGSKHPSAVVPCPLQQHLERNFMSTDQLLIS
ncbi:Dolichyl-diphosphooligosaccharide--protein glycosyltransferase subunit 1B [Camellia lanceoleosa]|uniref:Dolichyl-diphosphooligosaccharide--protein glycosyltransferase subunit 1B n=1 Tax=Camellia lanceoleosa TaxID=1840588 RepID=A0ACC0H229_9ERIC|nr:Dolichyl-diphosphooligosaccharide--protein glycosyltransferase subunit 1B [Camellia lanceoleosa]